MEMDGLPRLLAQQQPLPMRGLGLSGEPTVPIGSSGGLPSGASSARRGVGGQRHHPRSAGMLLPPRSAGAGSPQRRSGSLSFAGASAYSGDDSACSSLTGRRPSTSTSTSRATPRKTSGRVVVAVPNDSDRRQEIIIQQQQPHDSAFDWQRLQGDNAQLRVEIAQLQKQLVEKMRSHAKILVGGGQFRAAAAGLKHHQQHQHASPQAFSSINTNNNQGMTTPSCGSCGALRMSLKNARDAEHQVKEALSRTTAQLEMSNQTWESLFRHRQEEAEEAEANDRLLRADNATAAAQQLQEKDQEMESLRCELERLRLRVPAPREVVPPVALARPVVVDTATQSDGVSSHHEPSKEETLSAMEQSHRHHQQRVLELEASHLALQSLADQLQGQLLDATRNHTHAVELFENERAMWQTQQSQLDCKWKALVEHIKTVADDEVARLRQRCEELEQAHVALSRAHQQLQETHECELAECIQTVENLKGDHTEQVAHLSDRIKALEDDLERTTKQQINAQAMAAVRLEQLAQTHHQELLETSHAAARSNEMAARLAKSHQQALDEMAATHGSLMLDCRAQLTASETARQAMASEYELLLARFGAAEADATAQQALLQRLQKSHASAMEKAMQSLVRLCVVAPTVNVHLNGSGSSSSSGSASSSSSTVTCKSLSLPHKQLRDVIEKEVLPLFAQVFVQHQEKTSPVGGPMDPWLQGLLRDMQESLATHLHKLYTATTTTTTTTATGGRTLAEYT